MPLITTYKLLLNILQQGNHPRPATIKTMVFISKLRYLNYTCYEHLKYSICYKKQLADLKGALFGFLYDKTHNILNLISL